MKQKGKTFTKEEEFWYPKIFYEHKHKGKRDRKYS
jgi:hypothetical protein